MSRFRVVCSFLAATVFLAIVGAALAAGPSDDAKKRAVLYQAEAVKVLPGYHWAVMQNRPGRFTAVHTAYPGGATFDSAAVFRSDSGINGMPTTMFM